MGRCCRIDLYAHRRGDGGARNGGGEAKKKNFEELTAGWRTGNCLVGGGNKCFPAEHRNLHKYSDLKATRAQVLTEFGSEVSTTTR